MIKLLKNSPDLLTPSIEVSVEEIPTEEFQDLLEKIMDEIAESGGVGCAAPQIGVNKRVFVYRYGGEYIVVINPVYIKRTDIVTNHGEACLSIPGAFYNVKRCKTVTIEYLDRSAAKQRLRAPNKKVAFILQHEMDHLDGILITKGKKL